MFGELLIIVAISLFLFAFYKWATLNNDFFEKRNIKFIKPTFLFGSFPGRNFEKYTIAECAQMLYNAFPDEW